MNPVKIIREYFRMMAESVPNLDAEVDEAGQKVLDSTKQVEQLVRERLTGDDIGKAIGRHT